MTTPRPRLLCLHGGGASARIFQIQLVRLQRVLDTRFEFVFMDAPIETAPGPGVLPVFEGCGPYRRWVSDDPATPAAQFQTQKDRAVQLLKTFTKKNGPFVGLVGFSQGGRAAASLLLEHQREPFLEVNPFALFICGTFPPFVPHEGQKITAPTIHVIGLEDVYKPSSEELLELCSAESTRKVVRFPGGHHLPTSPETIQQLASMVLGAYKEASS
ncbi:Esterase FUS5 [Colletotrichum spinosum]|uniref:Esterase FUS5 n=1 Tax=Colletotrichum spinosum TaxID=1347390 RepID=A0A4R8QSK7_9PEZI|nr:Esterase FUS5 [Colletotrichum spinosum]